MIPRGLLPGTPIRFDGVQPGDIIDTRAGKQRSFCISKTVWERVEPGQEFTITKE